MAIASLILGIISLIVGFIPFCGAIAFIPAVIGLILGIVAIAKNVKRGMGIAGTVLSGIAIIIITLWVFVFGAALSQVDLNELNEIVTDYESSSYYYNY